MFMKSSFRDRTQEFLWIEERVKKSISFHNELFKSKGKKPPQPVVEIESDFNQKASKIRFGIDQTRHKLIKLAKMAKRTSVLDNPTTEIQRLTSDIKQDIAGLNSALVDLRKNSHNKSRNISSDATTHSTTVVDDLKNRLMSTAKDFKEVLSSMGTEQNLLSSYSASKNHKQEQLVPLLDSYTQSRAEAYRNVQSTIHEVGNIFDQLATLISQQGEIAVRIDDNIDDALGNMEGAQGEMKKYLTSISSNRWLIIKVTGVLIVFVIIFLVFFK